MSHLSRLNRSGFTVPEFLIAATITAIVMYTVSMIYFSSLKIYNREIWKLPPYDAATMAVNKVSRELMDGMLVSSHGNDYIVIVTPQKDSNHDNVLTLGSDGYQLAQGNSICFYLSDSSGTFNNAGNCLWQATQLQGSTTWQNRIKLADNIHPELNPTDPSTGLPHTMFRFYPDETRLWGVEMWMTSTATVHGQPQTQTAHSECYLRNL